MPEPIKQDTIGCVMCSMGHFAAAMKLAIHTKILPKCQPNNKQNHGLDLLLRYFNPRNSFCRFYVVQRGNSRYNNLALFADIAQVVERIHGKDEVGGSSPSIGTRSINENGFVTLL